MTKQEKLYDTLETALAAGEDRCMNEEDERFTYYWSGRADGLREALAEINRIKERRAPRATDEEVEKVLLGLECCSKDNSCNACPYQKIARCSIRVMQDSKALIQRMKTLMEE